MPLVGARLFSRSTINHLFIFINSVSIFPFLKLTALVYASNSFYSFRNSPLSSNLAKTFPLFSAFLLAMPFCNTIDSNAWALCGQTVEHPSAGYQHIVMRKLEAGIHHTVIYIRRRRIYRFRSTETWSEAIKYGVSLLVGSWLQNFCCCWCTTDSPVVVEILFMFMEWEVDIHFIPW